MIRKPAGLIQSDCLGWWPLGIAFLLDDPDALLESVEVAFVRSRTVGCRPA
jgi:hypothetical protein